MNSDLDRQPRRGQWPNPVDTPLDRARRVAMMYRAHLRAFDPAACDILDDTVAGYGETWMLDKPEVVDPDREVTANEAGDLAQVPPNTVHHWARLKHPDKSGRPLLPKFGWRGKERTFIAGKVLEAAAIMAKNRQHAS